uniref:RING-type domain-containing protein n=1 Tax=Heterorhabditis bacteriophora TaxID=37862 RepID=A0A1I7WUQ9_HETBA
MDPREEAEAREKVRQLMAQPPIHRPPEFVNPLEKIEQLLTCPICLDRYKCVIHFLSYLIIINIRRSCSGYSYVIIYIYLLQPNYTLTGFLEIHLQATPDSAAEIEEYIHRYNLERCKICDEKAECESCAHCDRKACRDCRQTHMEMLKRDMSRLLNQVRRLSNRITEASDGLSKGLELLALNCETTKGEVREYFHRYQRDLKKREDAFLTEIDTFQATESRLMSNLRDVLEIESSNMSEAVARLDAAIKGECALDDNELVRLKNTFSEGLEYLRNFQVSTLINYDVSFFSHNLFSSQMRTSCSIGNYAFLRGRMLQSYLRLLLHVASCAFLCPSSQDEKEEIKITARKPPLPRQVSNNDDSLNEKVDNIRRAHAERQAASRAASSDESDGEEARPRQRIRIVCRAASMSRDEEAVVPIPVTHFAGEPDMPVPAWLARRRQRFQRSRTNPDLAATFCSQRVQQLLQERSSRLDSSTSTEEERRMLRRSASRDAGEWRARGRPRAIFGRKGAKDGELNWPRGVCSLHGGLLAVCDSSNHRVCIFDKEGKFLRQFGGYGAGHGQLDSAAGIATAKQRLIVSDRYNHRVCLFDLDGNFISTFGGHGQGNGKFNNPWGVAVDDLGIIYVADKDNHRVQMFDKNGQFVGKFGAIGHGPGQLHNPLFVSVNKQKHQIYVSDSSNHRISVFDSQGLHLFSFGTEGFHGGQFKFPRGIAIDMQGNVLVADSGNNRIQVFSSDGEFISTFGSWGGGAGQLKGVEALCVSDGVVVASDRENHRIQIF